MMDHNKKTKLALLLGAVAAIISAAVLIIVFWDKLLALCPCRKKATDLFCDAPEAPEMPEEAEPEAPAFNEEEKQDFADLGQAE